jgi:hypothetical protein
MGVSAAHVLGFIFCWYKLHRIHMKGKAGRESHWPEIPMMQIKPPKHISLQNSLHALFGVWLNSPVCVSAFVVDTMCSKTSERQ